MTDFYFTFCVIIKSKQMKKNLFILSILFLISFGSNSQTYTNPILTPGIYNGEKIGTMADPFVLRDNGTYYMYVTGNGFPCFTSKDLVNWTYLSKALPKSSCKWAINEFWAPEVIKVNNKYYLNYSANGKDNIKHIGVAISDNPTGPFIDMDNKPFIDHGNKGTIDSDVFINDDGRAYMYYSNAASTNPVDELGGKKRSEIWVVEIKKDFSKIISEPKMLIMPEQEWEFNPSERTYWNEGTVLVKHNNIYYLMYSANCFCGETYSLGYATSNSPTGPFVKYANNPILSNEHVKTKVSGPGHHTVTLSPDGKEWFCVYHSHVNVGNLTKANNGVREINIDRMEFLPDGSIKIIGPTTTPQAYPSNID